MKRERSDIVVSWYCGIRFGSPDTNSTHSFSVSLRGEKPLIRASGVISNHPLQPEYSDLDHRLSRNVEFRAKMSQTRFQIREQG